MGKLADDLRPKCEHAHPDQRLEISLLGLFSYDRFSIVPPEKGWILPLAVCFILSADMLHTCPRIRTAGTFQLRHASAIPLGSYPDKLVASFDRD